MNQKDLFGNIVSEELEIIEVAAYTRKKKVSRKKTRTQSKVISKSPINRENLSKQSNKLIKYLLDNDHANFMDAHSIGCGTPHSRFAEISKWMMKNKTVLHRKMISISNSVGEKINCNQYWITEVDKPTIRLLLGF